MQRCPKPSSRRSPGCIRPGLTWVHVLLVLTVPCIVATVVVVVAICVRPICGAIAHPSSLPSTSLSPAHVLLLLLLLHLHLLHLQLLCLPLVALRICHLIVPGGVVALVVGLTLVVCRVIALVVTLVGVGILIVCSAPGTVWLSPLIVTLRGRFHGRLLVLGALLGGLDRFRDHLLDVLLLGRRLELFRGSGKIALDLGLRTLGFPLFTILGILCFLALIGRCLLPTDGFARGLRHNSTMTIPGLQQALLNRLQLLGDDCRVLFREACQIQGFSRFADAHAMALCGVAYRLLDHLLVAVFGRQLR
mmetsp:Transcript_47854/g.89584  ORF Transcript_47854/g.89584 Transcript_47854/m.89584 type:complete len:305 (+) Transcript_47854:74-988(+)